MFKTVKQENLQLMRPQHKLFFKVSFVDHAANMQLHAWREKCFKKSLSANTVLLIWNIVKLL